MHEYRVSACRADPGHYATQNLLQKRSEATRGRGRVSLVHVALRAVMRADYALGEHSDANGHAHALVAARRAR